MGLENVLELALPDPTRCALFADMDGTISNIIDDPEAAIPVTGAGDLLAELADVYGTVAVVSGRPVSFLGRFFGPSIELSGLYGLEHRTAERLLIDSAALEWVPVIGRCADDARGRFGTEAVEDKRYSLTVHYRTSDDEQAHEIQAWATQAGEAEGLIARPARMSVELHPPIKRSKGDVVVEMVVGMRSALYLGDDIGDLPAFEQLHALERQGDLEAIATVLVASDETPAELEALSTDVVDTPAAAVELLGRFRP